MVIYGLLTLLLILVAIQHFLINRLNNEVYSVRLSLEKIYLAFFKNRMD